MTLLPAQNPFDRCAVCGERAWQRISDGKGGTIYAYNCTAEIVVNGSRGFRTVKDCPNWEKISPTVREDM